MHMANRFSPKDAGQSKAKQTHKVDVGTTEGDNRSECVGSEVLSTRRRRMIMPLVQTEVTHFSLQKPAAHFRRLSCSLAPVAVTPRGM